MRYKKSFVLVAIIVIGLAVFIGYQYYRASLMPSVNLPQNENLSSTPANPHPDWKTFTDVSNVYSFQYPLPFGANVWKPTSWPPKVTAASSIQDALTIGCPNYQSGESTNPAGTSGMAGTLPYTLYQSTGVGAGNLWNEYCFVYPKGDQFYAMNIEINSHTACGQSCGAYCGTPFEQECATLDRSNAIEKPVMDVGQSFKFLQ